MFYKFYGQYCPMKPKDGEERFPLTVALQEGATVEIVMGRQDFLNVAACLVAMLAEDEALSREVRTAAETIVRKKV